MTQSLNYEIERLRKRLEQLDVMLKRAVTEAERQKLNAGRERQRADEAEAKLARVRMLIAAAKQRGPECVSVRLLEETLKGEDA